MVKVIEAYRTRKRKTFVICDFSPPRGSGPGFIEDAASLDVDFISVAYNPGKSVRVDSAMLGYAIKEQARKEVVFNLATRDMNRLAIQSHLLGASVLGLENLVVVNGDPFRQRDLKRLKDVSDFAPTELMRDISNMNQGVDFRDVNLTTPTDFCIGGSVDLARDVAAEVDLTHRKALAGAQFFITQPIFDVREIARFLNIYQSVVGTPLVQPVFWGLQIMVAGGVTFSSIPYSVRRDLEAGRDGVEMAVELWERFVAIGIESVYLIPPILKGGARDYHATQRFVGKMR